MYNTVYVNLYKTGIMTVVNKMLPLVCMCLVTGYTIYTLKKKQKIIHPSLSMGNIKLGGSEIL